MQLLKKTAKILSIILLSLISVIVIAFVIVSTFILPPKKLTPLVTKIINENLNAEFNCESIELTYFSTFPSVGVHISRGHLLSDVAKDTIPSEYNYSGIDTLLTFIDCKASLNIADFILRDQISINEIDIDNARIYGYINTNGQANWDIFKSDTTNIASDTTVSALPIVNMKQLKINNSKLSYYNRQQQLYTSIDGLSANIKGDLTAGTNTLETDISCNKFRFYSEAYSLPNPVNWALRTKLKLSNNYHNIEFENTKLTINDIPFILNGKVYNNSEDNTFALDISHELNAQNLGDLLSFVPQKYIKQYNLSADGKIVLKGSTLGLLGNNQYPTFNSSLHVSESTIQIQGLKVKTELDLNTRLDINNNDSSFIDINKIKLESEYLSLDANAKLHNIFSNLSVDTKLKSDINFTKLSKIMFHPDTLSMQGTFKADMDAQFTLDDILSSNIGKVKVQGKVNVDQLKINSRPYDLNAVITRANVDMTSERKDDRLSKDASLLNAKLYIDSLDLQYGVDVDSHLKNFYFSLSSPKIVDTTQIIPLSCRVSFDRMKTMLADSTMLYTSKTTVVGAILPNGENKKEPKIIAMINSDSLIYLMRNIQTGTVLTNSSFDLKLTPFKRKQRSNTQQSHSQNPPIWQRDATFVRQQRDSTFILTGVTSNLFSKLEFNGNLKFDNMRIWSAYLPIRVQILKSNLSFTSNDIQLTNTKLLLGKSDFLLNGKISSLRRALLRGGQLTATLNTTSDYINCNELMETVSRGLYFAENTTTSTNKEMQNLQDLQTITNEAATENTGGIFVLPKTLNLELQTEAKKIEYDHLELLDSRVQVNVKDQSLQLTNLYSNSNIGHGNMSFFYTAKNRKEASIGIDLDVKDILVNKFIELIPAVDTLIPMLKSFEGVLDCKLVATTLLDSTASVNLTSMQAACNMSGKQMVLLDGQTFTEISKTLMFKNKKKNIIDNLAVDLTIEDGKIEVYPFLLEMDRYRVAVGGTHNMDMSFEYHVSVLKSPVPFKLGINITGTIDKYKYKITKCRYKDMFKSVKSGIIDTTNLNIRDNIYANIRNRMTSNLSSNYKSREVVQKTPKYDPAPEIESPNIPDTTDIEEPASNNMESNIPRDEQKANNEY